jgi:murein DD-endopeptidase MepM/ murein hydrolase activator NlpD
MKSKLVKGMGIALVLGLGAFLYVKYKPAGNNSFFAIKDSLAQTTIAPPQAEDIHAIPSQLPQDYFGQPLHGNLTVSGSFAELRANHFHSGIDFRTEGGEGRPVLASADGYVSRIRIGPYGFGKALYIAHPNGYTTVYGHLKYFNGNIQTYAVNQQYKTESFDQELYLGATILLVKKGDTIAWSGNTGGSGGPHLHFEIRKSSNDQIINPLLFGLKIKDNIDPFIKSMLLVRINDSLYQHYGYFPERISRQAPALKKTKELIHVPTGKYGLALSDVDYFVDFASRLGIN